jgi:hypothetical protein
MRRAPVVAKETAQATMGRRLPPRRPNLIQAIPIDDS